MYRERPSRVPGAWVWTAVSETPTSLVLPDGCIDLLWDGGTVRIAGPDRVAHRHASPVGTTMVGLRFAPGAAPAVLGVPADELTDRQVPLADVWHRHRVDELTAALAAAADAGDELEAHVLAVAGAAAGPSPVTRHVVARLRAGDPVDDVADGLGVGRRQLHRRCLASFGYGPKHLARVLRLGDALALARRGVPLAAAAADTGYADQAHLARDARALTGSSPRQLL